MIPRSDLPPYLGVLPYTDSDAVGCVRLWRAALQPSQKVMPRSCRTRLHARKFIQVNPLEHLLLWCMHKPGPRHARLRCKHCEGAGTERPRHGRRVPSSLQQLPRRSATQHAMWQDRWIRILLGGCADSCCYRHNGHGGETGTLT